MSVRQKGKSEIAKLLQTEKANDKIKQTFEGKVFYSKPEKTKVKCVHPSKEKLHEDKEKLNKW